MSEERNAQNKLSELVLQHTRDWEAILQKHIAEGWEFSQNEIVGASAALGLWTMPARMDHVSLVSFLCTMALSLENQYWVGVERGPFKPGEMILMFASLVIKERPDKRADAVARLLKEHSPSKLIN